MVEQLVITLVERSVLVKLLGNQLRNRDCFVAIGLRTSSSLPPKSRLHRVSQLPVPDATVDDLAEELAIRKDGQKTRSPSTAGRIPSVARANHSRTSMVQTSHEQPAGTSSSSTTRQPTGDP